MLRQLAPVLRNLTNASRISVRAFSAGGHDHHHPSDLEVVREHRSSLNDIPIPEGSWQEHYDMRNKKWTMALVASIVCFGATMAVAGCPFCRPSNSVKALKDTIFSQVIDFHTLSRSEIKKMKINVD